MVFGETNNQAFFFYPHLRGGIKIFGGVFLGNGFFIFIPYDGKIKELTPNKKITFTRISLEKNKNYNNFQDAKTS